MHLPCLQRRLGRMMGFHCCKKVKEGEDGGEAARHVLPFADLVHQACPLAASRSFPPTQNMWP